MVRVIELKKINQVDTKCKKKFACQLENNTKNYTL